ncbi:MAG: ribonuclease Z [Elusimicrobiaceae bacterium]|nr:ribonuclease Z [Elusimicrobiaceae bacterium]
MKVIILGSGGFYPDVTGEAVRNPAGYAVDAGAGVLVFDLGFGNVRQLARAGIELSRISHVFLSHFHPDHWGDLPALLFAYRYNAKPLNGRLTIAGPAGLSALVARIRAVSPGYFDVSGYAEEVIELEPGREFVAGACRVGCMKVEHGAQSLAYKIRGPHEGETVCYTGDAMFSAELRNFCARAELVIADAGCAGCPPGSPHMTPAEAVSLSDTACVCLSHLCGRSAEQAEELAGGRIFAARDLQVIDLPLL